MSVAFELSFQVRVFRVLEALDCRFSVAGGPKVTTAKPMFSLCGSVWKDGKKWRESVQAHVGLTVAGVDAAGGELRLPDLS